ncbi:hypothetical protein TNCV_2446461 [Trichonephila clavipes]|nr:hypothetical protein TNCV_2446461 [Trichonephila clavipes]
MKVSNRGSIPRSPLDCNVVAFIVLKYRPMIPPAHKEKRTKQSVFWMPTVFRHAACGLAYYQMRQLLT